MAFCRRFGLPFALLLLGAATLFAQGTTANLTGTVTSGGTGLPGATVTVSSPSLQGVRTTVTSETGSYVFVGLPPGEYTVRIELQGMQTVTRTVRLQLAQTSRVDADLRVSAIEEAITVTATAPAVLETSQVGTNIDSEMLDKLPVARTIAGAVGLAPGVSNGIAGFTISGAPSYDNVYLVNGTVVNENVRGQPHNLFIEDAIQETTVLTGGISAEYGRFTGGVISTITKSGGNEFRGSFRDSLTNAKWTGKTPWPTEADHIDKINSVYEETLGGYLWRDRIWFFGAGRQAKTSTQRFTTITNIPYTFGADEKRIEAKLTGQITARHNLTASYLDISDVRTNDIQFTIMDLGSVFNRELPNSLVSAQYNGVITTNLFVSANYANKKFAFVGSGSPFRDRIFGTLMVDNPTGRRYWTSTFCGTCTDEERNNFSWTAKANYFLSSRTLGSHTLVAGVDRYSETRLANNHQSGSDFRILGNVRIVGTDVFPVLDSTSVIQWNPIFQFADGSHLKTDSLFVNDRWDFNPHFSFNVGVRYDKNDAKDDDNHVVSDDSAFSPRLGLQYDIRGDGRHKVNLNFGRYVTKIAEGNVGGGANASGNPSSITWFYRGPAINPAGTPVDQLLTTDKALEALWAWFDSVGGTTNSSHLRSVSISGLSTILPEPIVSPSVDEWTLGYGVQFARNAYVRGDLIMRDWNNFYATELRVGNPRATDPFGQSGDVAFIRNSDDITREYRGIQLQAQWRPGRFYTGGSYTYSTLEGNDSGEAGPTATSPNTPLALYYPEYLGYANRLPQGWLPEDIRHRAKAWIGYDLGLGRAGTLSASALQTYETGSPYSVVGSIDASGRTAGTAYTGLPANPGYTRSQLGTSHTYFFSDRGALRTEALNRTDISVGWSIPIARVSLFAEALVTNVFDMDAVLTPDATVFTRRTSSTRGLGPFNPFTETPVECPSDANAATCSSMGAHFQKATTFGQAVGVSSYQTPRTYSFTAGLRF
jgi:outer membrane receptor protein involved in Fe transport